MQRVTGIGGVFFRAKDAEALAHWYEQNLGISVPEKPWVQQGGQTVFMPFGEDTDYFGQMSQQWMLCFRVANVDAMIAQLRTAGVEAIQKAEWNSKIGVFARIHDPEGNPIELWQPATDDPSSNDED
jgi:glyoxylase I family protein